MQACYVLEYNRRTIVFMQQNIHLAGMLEVSIILVIYERVLKRTRNVSG